MWDTTSLAVVLMEICDQLGVPQIWVMVHLFDSQWKLIPSGEHTKNYGTSPCY